MSASYFQKSFELGGVTLPSRLLTGTGKYASAKALSAAVDASDASMVTVALKRVTAKADQDSILSALDRSKVLLLPNTSGARDAREAVLAAELAREALETDWIKVEVHPDPKYLMPDPVETLKATEILAAKGFKVLPYVHADPVLCKRLQEVGAAAVMPLGAPIGSNLGLRTIDFLRIIIEQASLPVIVDAGLGAPSHAAAALEMGADAVLVNTAIADAQHPAAMGRAFKLAVEAGRIAFEARLAPARALASSTSPLTSFLSDTDPHEESAS
jgi:thiazole synthase